MTTQRLKTLSKLNNVKVTGKVYSMAEMIQESYKVSYAAKKLNNKKLISITESHLINVKKNPTKTAELSSDLEAIKKLVRLGECNKFKDLEEVAPAKKKKRRRKTEACMKPAIEMKESWQSSRARMGKALKSFRESAKTKVFYKELGKFNNKLAKGKAISISEAIDLYKASNSCLTHLTVELDRNPKFISTFKECTSLLSRDNLALLEAIQKKKVPSKSILESFAVFTNILLECDAPETLDKDKYPVDEDADMETLADRDVINEDDEMETIADRDVIDEDADMETLADRDVIDEDADMETLADRDVIDEDADMETIADRDVINEEDDMDDIKDRLVDIDEDDDILPAEDEELEEDEGSVTVDLTPDEVALLRKILQKVSGLSEEAELVPDEEVVPELEEEEELAVEEPELEEDDDIIPEEDLEEDEDEIIDPDLEEDEDIIDDEDSLEEEDEVVLDDEELEEDDEEEILEPELEEDDDIIPEEDLEEDDEEEVIEPELEEEDEINPEELEEEDEEDIDAPELEEDEDIESDEDELDEDEDCDPDMEECNESEEGEEDIETKLSESAMRRIRRGCF